MCVYLSVSKTNGDEKIQGPTSEETECLTQLTRGIHGVFVAACVAVGKGGFYQQWTGLWASRTCMFSPASEGIHGVYIHIYVLVMDLHPDQLQRGTR